MTSRSFRLETRSRARDDIKRSMQMVEKVRKWEKRWIDLGLSNSLKVYKWVPVREAKEDDEDEDKENQPMELTEQDAPSERALPDINPGQGSSQSMGTELVVTDQSLPELLMAGSEDGRNRDASKPLESSSGESSVNALAEASLALESQERGDASGSVTGLWTDSNSRVSSSERDQQLSPSAEVTQSVAANSSTSPTLVPPALSEAAVSLPTSEDFATQQVSVSGDTSQESAQEQGGPLATTGEEPLAVEMGKKEEDDRSDERTGGSNIPNSNLHPEQSQTAESVDIQRAHDIEKRVERQNVDRDKRTSRSPTEKEEKMSRSRSRSRSPHT